MRPTAAGTLPKVLGILSALAFAVLLTNVVLEYSRAMHVIGVCVFSPALAALTLSLLLPFGPPAVMIAAGGLCLFTAQGVVYGRLIGYAVRRPDWGENEYWLAGFCLVLLHVLLLAPAAFWLLLGPGFYFDIVPAG